MKDKRSLYFVSGVVGKVLDLKKLKGTPGILYHATASKNLRSIQKTGLKPAKPFDYSILEGQEKSISFSSKADLALEQILLPKVAVLRILPKKSKKLNIYRMYGLKLPVATTGYWKGADRSDYEENREHRIVSTIPANLLEVSFNLKEWKPLQNYQRGKRGGLHRRSKAGKKVYKRK